MTTLQSKTVTTRKRHRCSWCDRWIEVGEKADYWAGISPCSGEFTTDYFCAHCDAAATIVIHEWPWAHDPDDGMHLPDTLHDLATEYPEAAQLHAAMLRRWRVAGSTELEPIPGGVA